LGGKCNRREEFYRNITSLTDYVSQIIASITICGMENKLKGIQLSRIWKRNRKLAAQFLRSASTCQS
jgi:hypothetical protein